jgi:hypothetical protein
MAFSKVFQLGKVRGLLRRVQWKRQHSLSLPENTTTNHEAMFGVEKAAMAFVVLLTVLFIPTNSRSTLARAVGIIKSAKLSLE